MAHDLRCAEADAMRQTGEVEDSLPHKHEADGATLYELESITPNTVGERLAIWMASEVIRLKEKIGCGIKESSEKGVAKELHTSIHKTYPRRKIITYLKDETHSVDLGEMFYRQRLHIFFLLYIIGQSICGVLLRKLNQLMLTLAHLTVSMTIPPDFLERFILMKVVNFTIINRELIR